MARHLPLVIAILILLAAFLSGCAAPMASTIVSAALTVTTGKGLTEHALSEATGRDCNILGTVFNPDRELCEVPGSPATKGEFRGIFALGSEKEKPLPKPVLMRVNGKLVYTMAPVTRAQDIAHAETVRALPEAEAKRHRRGGETKPVLVRVKGKLIYTMAPVMRAQDIHGPRSPAAVEPAGQP